MPPVVLTLMLSLSPQLITVPLRASADVLVSTQQQTAKRRQQLAELAERARSEALEARRLGHVVRACSLDRVVLRLLSLADGPETDPTMAMELISAQRDVAICQENSL
jgi:hypothetical protein